MVTNFLGYFKNITFKVKPSAVIFGQLWVEIGLHYNLTYGHADLRDQRRRA